MNTIHPSCAMVRRRALITSAAGAAWGMAASVALGEPTGATVTNGLAEISQNGSLTTIEASNNTIINWNSFNIASSETVQFIQPGVASRVLNRVTGPGPSSIDGSLIANGKVYIVNPAGVIFGPNAVVNVGTLYAAAGNMTDESFINRSGGEFTSLTGTVVNEGSITSNEIFGAVHLIGRRVENHGRIVTDSGFISMTAGHDVIIKEFGNANFGVIVDGRKIDPNLGPVFATSQTTHDELCGEPAVLNTGLLSAPNGPPRAAITLGAGDMYALAILNTGEISSPGNVVTLSAGSGVAWNKGLISASVDSGQAGSVYLQGPEVINSGTITADSNEGEAGYVEISSQTKTLLGEDSVTSASGGSGDADAGAVFVHSFSGDTVFSQGALIDASGGDLGGDGGSIFLGAEDLLVNLGTLDVGGGPGGADGSVVVAASFVSTDPANDEDIPICDGDDDDGGDDDDDDGGDDDDGDGDIDGRFGGVSADLAGVIRERTLTDFVQLEAHDIEALNGIAVLAREVRTEEALSALVGRAIWNDLVTDPDDQQNPLRTAATRIDIQSAHEALEIHRMIFGMPEADQTTEVSETLAFSFDRYMSTMSIEQATTVDPLLFRSWVGRQEEEGEVRLLIERLEMLLDRLASMGLTEREFLEARERILDAIAPSGGFDVEFLIRVLEAGPIAALERENDLAESMSD